MVAERLDVGVDGVVEVERLPAALDEREDARRGVVAGADHEGVVAVERADTAREAAGALGVVEDVLDVGVVEEPRHSLLECGDAGK